MSSTQWRPFLAGLPQLLGRLQFLFRHMQLLADPVHLTMGPILQRSHIIGLLPALGGKLVVATMQLG